MDGNELFQWLKNERNILQNSGSLMWSDPEMQRKSLTMADHLDKVIQYIELRNILTNEN
jgi:hypothetical protein